MDDFLRSLSEIERVEDKSAKTDLYVGLFQKIKYKQGAESIILLLKMMPLFEDCFQLYYHLFNHFLMLKMYDESFKFIDFLCEDSSRVREMAFKYPICSDNGGRIADMFSEKKPNDIIDFINQNCIKLSRGDLGAKYFEMSIKMRDAGIDLVYETYFNKAISLSEGKAKVKMVLTFCATLVKMGKKQNAKNILSAEINNTQNEDALPMMYKLAALFEEEDSDKALKLYREIERIDPDFLDTKERISKLTNDKNRYKINRLTEDDMKDDSNIHF